MTRRKLKDLNLLDDFLFGTMISYPGIGEKFVRELLRVIFGREFGRVTVVPQKPFLGLDTDRKGARLDVYLEENNDGKPGDATIYDVEPDKNNSPRAIAALPRRTRFYHAMIDAKSLGSGESYESLKKVVVVMITSYDPFGRGRMMYTVRSMCEEDNGIPFDDGAKTVYLYTGGTPEDGNRELWELLHYLENTRKENAVNETLRDFQQMVDTVKRDREVDVNYMKVFEREAMLIEQGRAEEKVNTERERQRAEMEFKRAETERRSAEKATNDLRLVKKLFAAKSHHPQWNLSQLAENCGCSPDEAERLLEEPDSKPDN